MYRFRIVDGSQARFYNLNSPFRTGPLPDFYQIGTDDGLLEKPVSS